MNIPHLEHYEDEDAFGPIQKEEALFLFALTRVLRPKVIVEFGFLYGHSARNFLFAMEPCSALFSFDIDNRNVSSWRIPDNRFHFIKKSQEDFEWSDIGKVNVDMVFFDASHNFIINSKTFNKIMPCLLPTGIIIVHDTGTWSREHMREVHYRHSSPWISSTEKAHRYENRKFVDWIQSQSDWHALHLHSVDCLRHGLTILQRHRKLT